MAENKVCIICRKVKKDKEFNEEHVIPEAIGGTFTINSVCRECNSNLGRLVDIWLTNNLISNKYRKKYKLKGKTGKIPPVLKGHTVHEGKKLAYEWDGCNKPRLFYYTVPKIDSVERLISVSGSDLSEGKKVLEKARKKHFPNKQFAKIEVKEFDKNINVKISSDRIYNSIKEMPAKLQMPLLKIAYEFAVETIPEYFNDNMAVDISKILENNEVDKATKNNYCIFERIDNMISISENSHLLHLFSMNQKGFMCLACSISIFGVLDATIKLSDKYYDLTNKNTVLITDVSENKHELHKIKDFISCILKWQTPPINNFNR